MTDIETRLRATQTQLSQASAQRVRDEVERDNAEVALTAAKEALKTEFGINTSEDLNRVRGELQATLETEVAEVEKQLAAALEA